MSTIRVAVNGYGVIGKRVADALRHQEDMQLVGVADIAADWRVWPATEKSIPVFATSPDRLAAMREKGLAVLTRIVVDVGETPVVELELSSSSSRPHGGLSCPTLTPDSHPPED